MITRAVYQSGVYITLGASSAPLQSFFGDPFVRLAVSKNSLAGGPGELVACGEESHGEDPWLKHPEAGQVSVMEGALMRFVDAMPRTL